MSLFASKKNFKKGSKIFQLKKVHYRPIDDQGLNNNIYGGQYTKEGFYKVMSHTL